MKITDIKVTPSLGAENRHWSLLKIFTDEGIVGLGEWAGGPIGQLKRMLIGRDPTNINQLHYDHLWQMQGRGAGVEIALWDIRGKQLNAPMHELLGGKLRDRIRVYCDCHSGAHWTREDYQRRWQETRASGQLDPVYETSAYVSKIDPLRWGLDTLEEGLYGRRSVAKDVVLFIHARLEEAEPHVGVDGGKLLHHGVGVGIPDRRVGHVFLGQVRIDGTGLLVALEVVGRDRHLPADPSAGLSSASMRRSGSQLSHEGRYQLRPPNSSMLAGTRTERTRVASRKIATASPKPTC